MARKKKAEREEPPTAATMAAMDRAYAQEEVREPPLVAEGHRWKKVKAPRPWRPRVGEVLVAKYLTRTSRPSNYGGGTYSVVTLDGPDGPVNISGAVISSLFDAAGDLPVGKLVRVTYKGKVESQSTGHHYNDFDLWVEA